VGLCEKAAMDDRYRLLHDNEEPRNFLMKRCARLWRSARSVAAITGKR